MVTGILNRRLTVEIKFHDTLHRCRTSRGMGNVSFKYKLLQKMTMMKEEVLYKMFLDLHKAYDALDCCHCIGILAA